MKRIFIFTFVLFLAAQQARSQLFWDELTTGVSVQLSSVSNVNGYIAWACGQQGTVIRTINSGYNWSNRSGNGIPNTTILINIFAVDSSTALTAGYIGANTFVYRTSNGGLNWTQVFTQANGFINAVWMTSALNGYMQGDPVGSRWSLWKTTNGGVNWDSTGLYLVQAGSEAGWNNSLWLHNARAWFGTNNSRVYYSTNSGVNWAVQSTNSEINSYSIAFDTLANANGFSGGATLQKTTNNGQVWAPNTLPGSGNIFGIALAVSPFMQNTAWVCRGSNIYYSQNLGLSWSTQFTSSSGTYTHMSRSRASNPFTGPGYIYATKSNGGITRGNMIVEGVTIISGEIPQNFTLSQNFPNPFNPKTRIVFSLAKMPAFNAGDVRGAFVSLKIYDLLGRQAADLHHKIIQPGTYEAEWDASAYPSGMYICSYVVSDPSNSSVVYSESRKMILLK